MIISESDHPNVACIKLRWCPETSEPVLKC
jgi:hypothetical protein